LVLEKSVLQRIHVYWLNLANIHATILHNIQKLMETFILRGAHKSTGYYLTKRQNIANPKENGGWGIRNIFWFAQSLAAKSCWRGLFGNSLWIHILKRKYLKEVDLTSQLRK
jgi:hypothetical protein